MVPPSPMEPPTFPKARQGYQRAAVDSYVAGLGQQLSDTRDERAALATENGRLTESLAALQSKYERLRTAELDERAQDILAAAEDDAAAVVRRGESLAADLVERAEREAQIITERARQEVAWSKRKLRAEQTELAAQQQALHRQLDSLRALALDAAQQSAGTSEADVEGPAALSEISVAEGDGAAASTAEATVGAASPTDAETPAGSETPTRSGHAPVGAEQHA